MKVTISIALDLSDFPAFNMPNEDSIRGALSNLGSLFHELHIAQLEKKCQLMSRLPEDEATREALLEHMNQDIDLTGQLFNDWQVIGTTDDGHTVQFNHKEPGYKERLLVDGEEVK